MVTATEVTMSRAAYVLHAPPLLSWQGEIQPVPLHRARVTFVGRSPRTFLTDADDVFRAEIRMLWRAARIREPLQGDLVCLMTFASRSRDSLGKHHPQPDVSNLIKAVEDAGNGFLWVDDRQIRVVIGDLAEYGPTVRPSIAIEVWGLT